MIAAWACLERLGFDPLRLRFTMRTTLAACLAVFLAWLAGLEHPQWSGMTVWAASLPIHGHLLEKSAFRALGTVIGAGFGIGLLLVSTGQPWIIVAGLSVWIGLCAGAGNVIRGFASYGVMLAGYTAAMVALLRSANASDPFAVGIDRLLTVLLGLLVTLVFGWLFAARGAVDDPAAQVATLSRRILGDLAEFLSRSGEKPADEPQRILSQMAAIEDGLDSYAAGSLRSRAKVKAIRRQLLAQVAVMLWMRRGSRPEESMALTAALRKAADPTIGPDLAGAALRRAAGLVDDFGLAEVLSDLAAAMAGGQVDMPESDGQPALALHRDWIGAREALFRATTVILGVGMIWLLTGWEGGPFMLLGAAIMTTIFSTVENPVFTLTQVLLGQTLGVVGALICRWLIWPLASSEGGLVLLMMPFILVGGFLFGHRRGAGPIGFDYNMVVLLLLQPAWPLTGSLAHSLSVGVAVILGPAAGLAAFMLIYPVSGERRFRTLVAMMVHEIEAMAANPGASGRRTVWRARLYHRVLRLIRRADGTDVSSQHAAANGSLALLLTGFAALHIDALLHRSGTPVRLARWLNATRSRLRRLGSDPQRAARALTATADRLAGIRGADPDLLREAAAELFANSSFIRQAGTP